MSPLTIAAAAAGPPAPGAEAASRAPGAEAASRESSARRRFLHRRALLRSTPTKAVLCCVSWTLNLLCSITAPFCAPQ